jgi:PAS domain S-box-containing protein
MSKPPRKTEQVEQLLSSPELARALETRHFKRFLDRLPIAIAISKLVADDQRLVYANQAFESAVGLPVAEIVGKRWDVLNRYRQLQQAELSLGQAVLDGQDRIGVYHPEDAGETALFEATVVRVETDEGKEDFRLLALIDVTETYTRREELERSVRERDLLLKELQHRVKNSLQLVAALIRLESRNAREGKTVNIQGIAGRVEALSILYRALSDSPREEEVDLGNYLSRIASAAMRSHAAEGIRLELKIDCCPTTVNLAMPAGLVVNEVITNALKHAFHGRENGVVELCCVRGESGYEISVTDDGVGLPQGLVFPPPEKISALIIQSLYENAGATLDVESTPDQGTRISFVVPFAPARPEEPVLPFSLAHSLMQMPHDAQPKTPDAGADGEPPQS